MDTKIGSGTKGKSIRQKTNQKSNQEGIWIEANAAVCYEFTVPCKLGAVKSFRGKKCGSATADFADSTDESRWGCELPSRRSSQRLGFASPKTQPGEWNQSQPGDQTIGFRFGNRSEFNPSESGVSSCRCERGCSYAPRSIDNFY
jgi:hypothetical protein